MPTDKQGVGPRTTDAVMLLRPLLQTWEVERRYTVIHKTLQFTFDCNCAAPLSC